MSRQGAGIPRTKTLANTQLEPTARGNGGAAAQLQTVKLIFDTLIRENEREIQIS